jgi:hypothetical protein
VAKPGRSVPTEGGVRDELASISKLRRFRVPVTLARWLKYRRVGDGGTYPERVILCPDVKCREVRADSFAMRAAAHVVLTPIILYFGWAFLSGLVLGVMNEPLDGPASVVMLGAYAMIPLGIWYGWRNRHR